MPRRNSATCGTPRASTMFSSTARYSRARSLAMAEGSRSSTGSACTHSASPVPGTPAPTIALESPRITRASTPVRVWPSSSILATVPTRAYPVSVFGTKSRVRSSVERGGLGGGASLVGLDREGDDHAGQHDPGRQRQQGQQLCVDIRGLDLRHPSFSGAGSALVPPAERSMSGGYSRLVMVITWTPATPLSRRDDDRRSQSVV